MPRQPCACCFAASARKGASPLHPDLPFWSLARLHSLPEVADAKLRELESHTFQTAE